MMRHTSSKGLHKNWRFDGLYYDITLVGGVPGIVILPPVECHYFFHAVAGGGDLLLTSRRLIWPPDIIGAFSCFQWVCSFPSTSF